MMVIHMLASQTACEWSAKWLREQCFMGAPSAVHCVFLIMGSLRCTTGFYLTILLPLSPLPLPLSSWQSAAVTTTGDAADHMMSWPSLWQGKHSRDTHGHAHMQEHTLWQGSTDSEMLWHARTHMWEHTPSTLPCHVTAQSRWASLSSAMSTGYRASWLVHLLHMSVLIGLGSSSLSLWKCFILYRAPIFAWNVQ